MAVTVYATDEVTPESTSPTLLVEIDTAGVFVVRVDLGNMESGDTVTVSAFAWAGPFTTRTIYSESFSDDVGLIAAEMLVVVDSTSEEATIYLEQTAGTFRTFPYRVLQVA